MNIWKTLDAEIKNSIVILLISIFIVSSFSVIFLYRNTDNDPVANILIEAHGMLLDILVFGIIVLYLNSKRDEKSKIQRFIDEIDDFRDWESEEAAYRIRGNIIRLSKLGITEIDLHGCYLMAKITPSQTPKRKFGLSGINLQGSNLDGVKVQFTDLSNADLTNCSFKNADLYNVNLSHANLSGVDFEGTNLAEANFQRAIYNKETKFPPWLQNNDKYYKRYNLIFHDDH